MGHDILVPYPAISQSGHPISPFTSIRAKKNVSHGLSLMNCQMFSGLVIRTPNNRQREWPKERQSQTHTVEGTISFQ